ncbi:hypothetical protein GH714_015277 [Hevea brasiliensis]|uniref:Lysosomal Pro-X carboxypeptidase n=1 Tax=Hevea brasiliensis TaxID=3981 RepID=A0A6A6LGY3_HEVBR|nr:hypothetical protein GH714_015277 [Hevea brasiliensis]
MLLLIFSLHVSAIQLKMIPRLGALRKHSRGELLQSSINSESAASKDFVTFFYPQTLDHFNYKPESYTTFKQRYVINFKYWSGPNTSAPIFAFFGAEENIDDDIDGIGFLIDNASRFKALLVLLSIVTMGNRYHLDRVKISHVALGALASSAPILYFDDIAPQNGYYSIVTKDFKRTFELKDYLDSIYSEAAQYNDPPNYPVTIVCGGIDGAPKGTDILSRIFAGVVAYMGNNSCYDMDEFYDPTREESLAWRWQTCSELVMPIGHDRNTMFPPAPFDLKNYIKECKSLFGVLPQPHWVKTYYGGHDLKLILHRFASNIIFSNGLRDPYSGGGVLENISDSIVALSTVNGSHCLDIQREKPSDPQWLVMQRKSEVEIIQGWISNYYTDLLQLKDGTSST